jgi:hypothetical protein
MVGITGAQDAPGRNAEEKIVCEMIRDPVMN